MEYSDFRKQYEEQHPASVPRLEYEASDFPKWFGFAVLFMFVTASLFSGVHTVPTAYRLVETLVAEEARQLAGLASFAFIEMGILVSAYHLFKSWSWTIFAIFIVCILMAMGANLVSVSRAVEGGDLGDTIVAVLFGVGAPLVATLCGKSYVSLNRSDRVLETRAQTRLQEKSVKHDKEVERAYKAYMKSNLSIVQVSNEVSIGQSAASSIGHKKVIDATVRVEQHLDAHPEDLSLSPRQLALKLGVGKSTANNVQRMRRGQAGYTNGQGDVVQ